MTANRPTKFVEVDARGRCNLNGVVERGRTYRATFNTDGTILLEPAVVLTDREMRELAAMNPEEIVSPVPKTPEEKVAFRKAWDKRVEEGK